MVIAVQTSCSHMTASKAVRKKRGIYSHAFHYRGNSFLKSPCRLPLSVHWPSLAAKENGKACVSYTQLLDWGRRGRWDWVCTIVLSLLQTRKLSHEEVTAIFAQLTQLQMVEFALKFRKVSSWVQTQAQLDTSFICCTWLHQVEQTALHCISLFFPLTLHGAPMLSVFS